MSTSFDPQPWLERGVRHPYDHGDYCNFSGYAPDEPDAPDQPTPAVAKDAAELAARGVLARLCALPGYISAGLNRPDPRDVDASAPGDADTDHDGRPLLLEQLTAIIRAAYAVELVKQDYSVVVRFFHKEEMYGKELYRVSARDEQSAMDQAIERSNESRFSNPNIRFYRQASILDRADDDAYASLLEHLRSLETLPTTDPGALLVVAHRIGHLPAGADLPDPLIRQIQKVFRRHLLEQGTVRPQVQRYLEHDGHKLRIGVSVWMTFFPGNRMLPLYDPTDPSLGGRGPTIEPEVKSP